LLNCKLNGKDINTKIPIRHCQMFLLLMTLSI
jgi:hypothetical protein